MQSTCCLSISGPTRCTPWCACNKVSGCPYPPRRARNEGPNASRIPVGTGSSRYMGTLLLNNPTRHRWWGRVQMNLPGMSVAGPTDASQCVVEYMPVTLVAGKRSTFRVVRHDASGNRLTRDEPQAPLQIQARAQHTTAHRHRHPHAQCMARIVRRRK